LAASLQQFPGALLAWSLHTSLGITILWPSPVSIVRRFCLTGSPIVSPI
jgi:hypothetical protein